MSKEETVAKNIQFSYKFKQWMKYANKLVYKDNIQVVYLPSLRVLATWSLDKVQVYPE